LTVRVESPTPDPVRVCVDLARIVHSPLEGPSVPAIRPQNKRPTYALEGVDNALALLQLLRDEGCVRLMQASDAIGVAPSTAHRLLAMLVYRGFAVRDDAKRYLPGPAMGVGPAGVPWIGDLRERSTSQINALCESVDESVNLMIRVGRHVRFISSTEGIQLPRVGNRRGSVLPASETSGGKALLAELPRAVIDELYRSSAAEAAGMRMGDVDYARFLRVLERTRSEGYGLNIEETEQGVMALGVTVHSGTGAAVGALCVAVPSARFARALDSGLAAKVITARNQMELDLHDLYVESSSA
jgi:IclR family acetate operon transcriptional repressor